MAAAMALDTLKAICMPASEHFSSLGIAHYKDLQRSAETEKQCRRKEDDASEGSLYGEQKYMSGITTIMRVAIIAVTSDAEYLSASRPAM